MPWKLRALLLVGDPFARIGWGVVGVLSLVLWGVGLRASGVLDALPERPAERLTFDHEDHRGRVRRLVVRTRQAAPRIGARIQVVHDLAAPARALLPGYLLGSPYIDPSA
jgi:hypothetical protein